MDQSLPILASDQIIDNVSMKDIVELATDQVLDVGHVSPARRPTCPVPARRSTVTPNLIAVSGGVNAMRYH